MRSNSTSLLWIVSVCVCLLLVQETECFLHQLHPRSKPIESSLQRRRIRRASRVPHDSIAPQIRIGRRTNNNNNNDNDRCHFQLLAYSKAIDTYASSIRNSKIADNNSRTTKDDSTYNTGPPNVDAMVAHAGKLRQSILEQQIELQQLEYKLICCTDNNDRKSPSLLGNHPLGFGLNLGSPSNSIDDSILEATINRTWRMFQSSSMVLLRKLKRVSNKTGPNNQITLQSYITTEMATIPRIVRGLVENPERIRMMVDPSTPTLLPHIPAIVSRLDRLEGHVAVILERVLNNRRHLGSIEPYLPEILERFDDIEPHLVWILDNIDALAPNTGLLLKHIDELLLYADCEDINPPSPTSTTSTTTQGTTNNSTTVVASKDQYALAAQLLPYLEYYVSRLDVIGPHLPLLRPHVPLLLKYNRIGKISPHIDKLFARGYKDLSASVNMDVLLFWFGWSLRIPGLPRLFFALPKSPWIVSFLANRLPKRFVRGRCAGVQCCVDNDYGFEWNNLQKEDD